MNLRQKLKMAEDNNDVTLRCSDPSNEGCSYIWNYSGDMPRATCPSCGYKVKVEDCKVRGDKEDSVTSN